jgi:hypothetical protein
MDMHVKMLLPFDNDDLRLLTGTKLAQKVFALLKRTDADPSSVSGTEVVRYLPRVVAYFSIMRLLGMAKNWQLTLKAMAGNASDEERRALAKPETIISLGFSAQPAETKRQIVNLYKAERIKVAANPDRLLMVPDLDEYLIWERDRLQIGITVELPDLSPYKAGVPTNDEMDG